MIIRKYGIFDVSSKVNSIKKLQLDYVLTRNF